MVKIVYAFFYAISLLPFRLLYCIADFEYFMMYRVIKYRRGIVRKNLTSSFPEKSEEEIIDIEKKFYRWFSDYFFEAVKLLSISDKELHQRFQVINSEEVEQCFLEGQNVAAILGHYCNWEWLSCVGIELPKSRKIGLIYQPCLRRALQAHPFSRGEWRGGAQERNPPLSGGLQAQGHYEHLRLHQRPGSQVGEHPPVASFPQPSRNSSVYGWRKNHKKDERCRVLCRDVAPEARLLYGNLQAHHP